MLGEHVPSAVIEPEAAILAQLPKRGYNSVEHWEKIWPEDGELAAVLGYARNTPRGMSPEADDIIATSARNHNAFLADTIAHLEDLTKPGKPFVSQPFSIGDESHFAYKDGARPPLDLKALNLPDLESDGYEPLAVVIHRQADDEHVTCVELVAKEGDLIRQYYLEDIRAAAGVKQHTKPRWVRPGDLLFSSSNAQPTTEAMATRKSGQTVAKLKATSLYDGRPSGKNEIIRPKPTRFEKQVAQPEHAQKMRRYIKAGRALAAVTAAISTAFFLSPEAHDPGQNKRITSAHELILPGGTLKHGGLTQAEAFFDEPELSRSRAAFEAYFRGDQEALRAQAQTYEYETGWMQPEAIAAIEKAESYDALIAAFNKAFDGLPITLATYNGEQMPLGLKVAADTVHQPTTDFTHAKRCAMNIVQLFNGVFDKEDLKSNMEQFEYNITGKMVKQGDIPLNGYHITTTDENGKTKHIIVLSDAVGADTTAHETLHGFDFSNNGSSVAGKLSWKIGAVSHPNQEHTTIKTYATTPTTVEGWNNVSEPYGNVDQLEDAATSGEAVLSQSPVLSWENSPLGEKQMTLIFQMEKESPGFTASLLQRTRTSTVQQEDDPMNNFLFEAKQYKVGAGVVLALSLAALLSGLRRSRLLRPIARRLRRKEAVGMR